MRGQIGSMGAIVQTILEGWLQYTCEIICVGLEWASR